jgi:mRNA interferase MazF
MKQGDIWMVNLNPTQGSEQAGKRPFVVISGDLLNDSISIVIGCPLTTTIRHLRSNLVLTATDDNGLSAPSEVLTHQIRSITKSRFKNKLGRISTEQLETIHSYLFKLLTY